MFSLFQFKKDAGLSTKLPPSVIEKITALKLDGERATGVVQHFYSLMKESLERLRASESEINRLTSFGYFHDHPDVLAEKRNAARLKIEHARSVELHQTERERSSAIRDLVARIDRYLNEKNIGGRLEIAKPAAPKLPKNENYSTIIDEQRREIERLKIELQTTRDAPLPAAEARKIAHAWLDRLAAQGAPDVMPTIESGRAPALATSAGYHYSLTSTDSNQIDPIRFIIWSCKPQIAAGLDALISENSDDSSAVSSPDRQRLISDLKKKIFECELIEELTLAAAHAAGHQIPRRADADLRAVLGLAFSSPEPRQ
jgi:hypothetical protein